MPSAQLSSDPPLIDIHGLRKSYGPRVVLDDLDLTLPAGVHALLGPNGAGKTTLVKILATLIPHDSGELSVLGLEPHRDQRSLRSLISLTGQFTALDGTLSSMENLEMLGRLYGLTRSTARSRGLDLLDRFDLAAARDTRAAALSGGMRRKLDIAAGLICRPRLMFLDEPTTGLDTRSRLALWDEVRSLAADGTSVLLTTQYLEEADALAEQIQVLHHGRIIAGGTSDELKARAGGMVVRVMGEDGSILEEIPTDGTASDIAVRLAGAAAERPRAAIELHRPTLDEVFLRLTEAEPAPAAALLR